MIIVTYKLIKRNAFEIVKQNPLILVLFRKIFDKSRTYPTCFIQDLNKAATDLRFGVSLVREMVGGEGRRVSKREGRIRRKFRVSRHRFGKPDYWRIGVGEA